MKKAFVFNTSKSSRGVQVKLNSKTVDIDFHPAPSAIGLKLAGKIGHAVAMIDAGQTVKTYSGKTIATREALIMKLSGIRMQCSSLSEFTIKTNSMLIYCDAEKGAGYARVKTRDSAEFAKAQPIAEAGAPFRRGRGRPRVINQTGSRIDVIFGKSDRLSLTVNRKGELVEAGKVFTRRRKPIQADPFKLKDIKIGAGREDAVESLAKIRRTATTLSDFINKTVETFNPEIERTAMAS
jgi:hypothetical protein